MQHERLEPGTHLRKNQKQILAMLRAAVTRTGRVWDPVTQTGSGLTAAIRAEEGGDALAEAEVRFSTDGIELEVHPEGGEAVKALALYTDTRWMLETLEGALGRMGA